MKNQNQTVQFNFRVTPEQKAEFDTRYFDAVAKGFRGSQSEYLRQILFPVKQES